MAETVTYYHNRIQKHYFHSHWRIGKRNTSNYGILHIEEKLVSITPFSVPRLTSRIKLQGSWHEKFTVMKPLAQIF